MAAYYEPRCPECGKLMQYCETDPADGTVEEYIFCENCEIYSLIETSPDDWRVKVEEENAS